MTHPDSEREACMTLEAIRDELRMHARDFRIAPSLPTTANAMDRLADAIDRHLTNRAHADARDAAAFDQWCKDRGVDDGRQKDAYREVWEAAISCGSGATGAATNNGQRSMGPAPGNDQLVQVQPTPTIYEIAEQCGAEIDGGEYPDYQHGIQGYPPTITFTDRQLEQFVAALSSTPSDKAE
jgi:hypothetical protein